MKERFHKVIKVIVALAIILGAYVLICTFTSIRIPCIFYKITGLACPSCGISRMFLSLLKFDFQGAANANPVIFVMLPFFAMGTVAYITNYIKTGNPTPKWLNVACIAAIVVLLLWAIFRNVVFEY